MKQFPSVCLMLAMLLCLLMLAGCKKEQGNTPESKTGMFFQVKGYADTVYSISESSMTASELTTITSLQGILAQTEAAIYIEGSEGATAQRLQALSEKYGFAVETVADPWTLIDLFADAFGGKYVLYNDHSSKAVMATDQTINYATTISGAEGWLMISKGLEEKAKQHNLSMGADATAENISTRSVFEAYKDKLSNAYLVHQDPANRNLRDYAIAGKAMCFYADIYDGDSSVKADILDWAKENAPILGWTANELNFVSANSLQSVVTVAADHAANLSLYSAGDDSVLKQRERTEEKPKAQQGKHYVAIVMSDGDNVQWMTRGFAQSSKYYGSVYRGGFPMTWTTSPALRDLAPDILGGMYETATANDLFIAGPSGVGYINATEYNGDSLPDYAAYTAGYMEATDLQYINFLDNYADEGMLDAFAAFPQIKGGIWSVGNKYIEGAGAVYWANGKPFVAARETLWRIAGDDESNRYYGFVERVAQRINAYSTDCTKIEGYTVVLAHAWSVGSMEYINRFVGALDEHVVLVTADQLLQMVSENVAHVNAAPEDISKEDLDDRLVPISSEQYDWNMVKDTAVTDMRDFTFDSKKSIRTWGSGNGGLQYDSVTWSGSDTGGKPALRLDGSDLDDVVDPLPNSWIYNMFLLSEDTLTDNYLSCYVAGGEKADANFRVRALYEQDGKVEALVLDSADYIGGSVDSHGWYKRTSGSPGLFQYDLRLLKGKKVLISIEQDDTGDGTGEIIFVRRIAISGERITEVSAFPNWSTEEIRDDWAVSGTVETHAEGVCLEAADGQASLSYTFQVSDKTKWAKFYVRMFVRQYNPDTNPKLQCTVNGSVLKAYNAPGDFVAVSSDKYRCIAYDLSDYVGQEITVTFASLEGQHAAIARILLAENCSLAEINNIYSDGQVKEIK